MIRLLSLLALGCVLSAGLNASDDTAPLTIEMTDPNIRITIPGLHGIEMGVHPLNDHKPRFRLRGSSENTSVSVITPSIETEISPISCAKAVADIVLAVSPVSREQMFLGRSNEHTFLIIYGLSLEQSVLLNTHIVSSSNSEQCIEAHVSMISTSEADIEPWFNGFGESNIEDL